MSSWYYRISKDLGQIPNCIDHFEKELDQAKKEMSLYGKTIEKHASELAGIVEYRYGQLQELEAILKFLNIQLSKVRSEKFKYYLEGYNRALSSRDCEKYVDGNKDVVDLEILVNDIALVRNKFLSVTKGLDTKNWMIGHIVRLRASGLDDARVS